MDWNIFLSFALGAMATIIPIIINNRFQAQQRDKDREEQRREAKIQSREKWIERDILEMMELLGKMMKLLEDVKNIRSNFKHILGGKESGILSQKEYLSQRKLMYDNSHTLFNEINDITNMIGKLVYSFDEDEIGSAWVDLAEDVTFLINENTQNINKEMKEEPVDESAIDEIGFQSIVNAGNFQRALREKLISIRDS